MFVEIMNTIASPVAIVSAIIALIGIIQSKNQFKRNMQVQERAINLGLLDDRTEILENIKRGLFSFNRERVRFLFDGEIIELIDRYDECVQGEHDYAIRRTEFINHLNELINLKQNEAKHFNDAYWEYHDKQQRNAYTQTELTSIRADLDKYRLTFAVDELGINVEEYSIIEIEDKIAEYNREKEVVKRKLPEKMRAYIKESISRENGGYGA